MKYIRSFENLNSGGREVIPYEDGTEVIYKGQVYTTQDPQFDDDCDEWEYMIRGGKESIYGVYHSQLKMK